MDDYAKLLGMVRKILLDEWDPLSVGGMPSLADEYDKYLPRIVAAVMSGESEGRISRLLFEIERDQLCVPEPRSGVCATAARSLVRLVNTP